jgi:carboxypeptidase D
MLAANDSTYYNVSGALIYDPEISSDYVQLAVPITPFVYKYNEFLNFNDTFLMQIADLHSACGFADYIDKYYKFPPSGNQPVGLNVNTTGPEGVDCDVWHLVYREAYRVNNCFNVYEPNMYASLYYQGSSTKTNTMSANVL